MVRIHRIVKFLVCIGLITLFLGCAATQNRESTGEYIDDSVITAEVKNVIFNEPSLKVFQISVETYQGIVQLSGFCPFFIGREFKGSERGSVIKKKYFG